MVKSSLSFLICWTALLLSTLAIAGSNQVLTYQGVLTNPNSNDDPYTSSQTVIFSIYSPGSEACLLYSESQTVTPDSKGRFSAQIGTGTRLDGGSYTFNKVFVNGLTLSSLSCASGSTYASSSTDDRLLSITVNGTTLTPSIAVKSVPYSLQAHEIDGWGLNNLVKVSSVGSPTTFTDAEMASVKSMGSAACNSGELLKWNGTGWICGTDATATSLAASQLTQSGANTGEVLKWNGSAWVPSVDAGGGVQSLNGSTATTQTFANGTSGTAPAFSTNTGTGAHTLNIPLASTASVTAGLISKSDYDTFNSKLGTNTSFTGDVSGAYNATSVDKIKGSAVSVSSLASGNFLKYNGSAWTNSSLASGDVTTALGFTPLNKVGDTMGGALNMNNNLIANVSSLVLKGSTSGTLALKAPNSFSAYALVLPTSVGSSGQMLTTDGLGNLSWTTPAAGGLTSLNGATVGTQTFANGTGGTTPAFSTNATTGVHTLNIPMANTATVAAGLISKTEYDTFNTKLGTSTTFSGDVSGSYNAVSVDKIKGSAVSTASIAAGNFLRYNGSAWVNSNLASSDIPSLDTSKITTGTLSVSLGGTGVASFTANHIVGTNGSGTVLQSVTCSQNQVISFDASGSYGCYNLNSIAGSTFFTQGGNSFSGPATLGTNDNFDLALKTNNTTQVVVSSAGNVGIGTTAPNSSLDVNGAINMRGRSTPAVSPAGQGRLYFDSTTNTFKISQNGGAFADILTSASGVGDITDVIAGTGLTGGATSGAATLNVNVGTTTGQIVQVATGNKLPVIDGSNLTNLTAGNITGSLAIANGGTGSSTANGALNALLPTQTSNAGKVLQTDGTNTSWVTPNAGTVTGVSSSNSYISISNGGTTPSITANIGTAANTLAAGDDSRITGALQKAGGAMTGALDLGSNALSNTGDITMVANRNIKLGNYATDPSTAGWGLAEKGKTWFNTATNEIKYWDGSTVKVLGVSGAGITSLNGSTTSSQSFGIGTSGPAPNFSTNTGTGVHTLNIPMANTTSVTAGVISKSEYDAFNLKLGSATSFSGDVSGTYNTISVDKIKSADVFTSSLAAGNFLKYNGSAWVNSNLAAGDIPGLDASKITTGTLPISRGGTGVVSFAANQLVGTNGTGTALQAVTCSQNQLLSFDASGNYGCYNLSTFASGSYFAHGGNSFGMNATLGTTDAYSLNLKTNNVVRMTVDTGGNIGIGATSPNTALDMIGAFTMRGVAAPSVAPAGQGRIYFDSTSNTFKISQNGGVFADVLTSASGVGDITDVIAGTGLTGGATSGAATLNVNVGTTTGQIVQVATGNKLPVIDGSNLTSLSAGNISWSSQSAGTVFAGPTGASGTPSFRTLASTDIPSLDAAKITSGTLPVGRGGTGVSAYAAGDLLYASNTFTLSPLAIGTSGTLLSSNGSGPVWNTPSSLGLFAQGGNSFTAAASLGTNDAYDLALKTNNTTRMTLTNMGKVGIGTSNPIGTLDVSQSNGQANLNVTSYYAHQTAGYALLNLRRTKQNTEGTVTAATILGDVLGVIKFWGTDGSNFAAGAAIQATQTGTIVSGSVDFPPASLGFYTTKTGDPGPSEKMLITSSGSVGIGTSAPATTLDVNGQIKSGFYSNSTNTAIDWSRGNVQTSAATTSSGAPLVFLTSTMFDGATYQLISTAASSTLYFSSSDVTTWRCKNTTCSLVSGNVWSMSSLSGHTILTILKAGTTAYVTVNSGF